VHLLVMACGALLRFAVVVVPSDPSDAELAENVASVMEATFVDRMHVPLLGAEELRGQLGMTPRELLECAGRPACLSRVRATLELDRLVVATLARGVGDELLLSVKLVDTGSGSVLRDELAKAHGQEEVVAAARRILTTLIDGAPPSSAAPAPLPHDQPSRRGSWVPIVVGGAGLALAATGGVLLATVPSDYDDLKGQCAPYCPPSRTSSLETRATAGYVLAGVGAAAVTAGIILWLLDRREPARRAWVAPAWGQLVVGGTF
jgi:hypothetical protein